MALTKVTTGGITDATIATADIADSAVATAKVADDAITTVKVLDSAVTEAKLGNSAVATAKVADNAITTPKIADENITLAKLEHGTSSNDGKFLRANNGADPSYETVSIPAGTTINNNADNRVITGSGTANTLNAESNVIIDSNGLGVGGAPDFEFQVTDSSGAATIRAKDGANNKIVDLIANSTGGLVRTLGSYPLVLNTNQTERMRIDSSGNVGIGTSSPSQPLHVSGKVKVEGGSTTRIIDSLNTHASGGELVSFQNEVNNHYGGLIVSGGEIDRECRLEAAWGSGFFTFHTNGAERMRIDASGHTFFSEMTSLTAGNFNKGINIENNSINGRMNIHSTSNGGNVLGIAFYHSSNHVGSIYYSSSATSYNTSSDYRLKENVTAISDGITRLKTLKPSRFNFKVDTDTTVDGFLAHEVTAVPEAVTGTKDGVVTQALIDSGQCREGTLNDPVYQEIDQSKLVPLLTAALQEAIAKIEVLETKVAALEAA